MRFADRILKTPLISNFKSASDKDKLSNSQKQKVKRLIEKKIKTYSILETNIVIKHWLENSF